jgi:hypothetical protein
LPLGFLTRNTPSGSGMTTALLGLRIGDALHEGVMVQLWCGAVNRHNANSPVWRYLDGTRHTSSISRTDGTGHV